MRVLVSRSMARKASVSETTTSEDGILRVYEVGYLLVPGVNDDGLPVAVGKIKEVITNNGGTVISEGAPEYIDLAYTMTREIENKHVRFDTAYFGWVKFECAPSAVAMVKEYFDRSIDIIRHLLIETVRDNTIISKKPLAKVLRKNGRTDKMPETDESAALGAEVVAEGASSEVIDQEIEKLVETTGEEKEAAV